MKKKLLVIVLIVTLLLQFNVSAKNDEKINEKVAIELAARHVSNILNHNTTTTLKDTFKTKRVTKLLSPFDNTISAFLVEFIDQSNKNNGYVVIGTDNDFPVIIEYGYDSPDFIHEKRKSISKLHKLKKENMYILGIGEYGCGEDIDQIYSLYSGQIIEHSSDIDSTDFSLDRENYIEYTGGYPEPPTSGNAIYNPNYFESSYTTFESDDVVDYNITYFTSKTLDPSYTHSDDCGSVAITNLFKYYYERNSAYSYLKDPNGWIDTFETIYSDIGGGASIWEVDSGIEDNSAFTGYIDLSAIYLDVINEVDFHRPFILLTQSHYYYSNHYVLGLGYEDYYYSNTMYNSTYVRIADSYSSIPNRFIHIDTGSFTNHLVKVTPY